MHVRFNKTFRKQLKKLSPSAKKKFEERLDMFMCDPHDELLRNHPLKGSRADQYSIDITGDVRAVYVLQNPDVAYFVTIGTHSELYE